MSSWKSRLQEEWCRWTAALREDADGRLAHPSGLIATLQRAADGRPDVGEWRCAIPQSGGPGDDCEWLFPVVLRFSAEFPALPPEVRFEPPVWHPNVDLHTGVLPLAAPWRPETSVEELLQQVRATFLEPRPSPVLNEHAAVYHNDRSHRGKQRWEFVQLCQAHQFPRSRFLPTFDLSREAMRWPVDSPVDRTVEGVRERVEAMRLKSPVAAPTSAEQPTAPFAEHAAEIFRELHDGGRPDLARRLQQEVLDVVGRFEAPLAQPPAPPASSDRPVERPGIPWLPWSYEPGFGPPPPAFRGPPMFVNRWNGCRDFPPSSLAPRERDAAHLLEQRKTAALKEHQEFLRRLQLQEAEKQPAATGKTDDSSDDGEFVKIGRDSL